LQPKEETGNYISLSFILGKPTLPQHVLVLLEENKIQVKPDLQEGAALFQHAHTGQGLWLTDENHLDGSQPRL
jgi:hypothetical protein